MKEQFCFRIGCQRKLKIEKLNLIGNILENKNIIIFAMGKIFDINQNCLKLDDLYILYTNHGKRIVSYLDGTYSLVIIDKIKRKLFVFQDLFGSNLNIYFYIDKKEILVSNELKQIIKSKNVKWKINSEAVKKFLKNGFINNKDTLVQFIHKVPGKKYLEINLNNARYQVKKYILVKDVYKIKKVDDESYIRTLKDICNSSVCENMGVTISSGYDTNFLIYNLRSCINNNLKAFSIGGTIGRNEVPDSCLISKYYKNIDFYSKLVDDNSLINFPEIVFALEGAIYESGIFLQYELAKLIKENNVKNIILGDCADQVLHYNLYHPLNSHIDKIKYYVKNLKQLCIGITIKPFKDIYEMASYKILKKNGILMNYYGINTQYPYLRRKFIEIAKKIVIKRDNNKTYHKKIINKTLPADIVKILKKIAGATELKTLFIGKITLDDIKRIAKKSKFYKEKIFSDEFYEIDYYMKIVYLEIFEKMFINVNFKNDKFNNNYNLLYFFPELNKEVEDGKGNISSDK